MDKIRIKRIKLFIGILFAVIVITCVIFVFIYSKSGGYNYLQKDYYIHRDIGTPLKLWINGYLGIFFRTKIIGFLNWLMILVLIYAALTFERRPKWMKAIFFVYIPTVVIIGIKGYMNFRYAFSLFPFTILALLWFIWDLFKKQPEKCRIIIFCVLFLLMNISFVKYYQEYKNYYLYAMRYEETSKGKVLIDFIKTLEINEENNILVNNIIEFYYFTDLSAIDFKDLGTNLDTTDKLFNEIKKRKIRFILVSDNYIGPKYELLFDVIQQRTQMIKRSRNLAVYEIIPNKQL